MKKEEEYIEPEVHSQSAFSFLFISVAADLI